MARTLIGLFVAVLLIGCAHAEQEQLQDLGLEGFKTDFATEIRTLQKNVTDLWTYIFQLRQAIEQHLTSLNRRQSRIESVIHHQSSHSGEHGSQGHDHHSGDHGSHSESGHRHEPLTSGSDPHGDHHHDDHSSDHHHHHGDHGSSDSHHDEHSTSDHHQHEDHGSMGHHQEEHGSSGHHHEDHHHHHDESHGTPGDHHGDEHHAHHGDYHHDEHHHDHHSTSESHTDHSNHSDSDHSKEHGHDDHHGQHHHDSHEKEDKSHGDHQHSHEHKDSHEKQDKTPDDQQSVEDIEKPFTVTRIQTQSPGLTPGSRSTTDEQSRSDPLNLLGGRTPHSHHHHHHHHAHEEGAQQTYEAKVTIPKYSEYRQYTFATCDVQPNRAIAPELQQEVKGQVTFWEKKTGGPLNVHVRLRGFSIGDHHGHQQQEQQEGNETPVHEAGHRHGFHVHEFGDLSAGCQSTGPHYNPFGVNHGGPKATERHVGDLGNIECDDHGVTNIVFPATVTSLTGEHSIVGKALVIHAGPDDYGLNKDDPESLRTGNAGTRIACCVIQQVEKLSLSSFRSIKSAANYQN